MRLSISEKVSVLASALVALTSGLVAVVFFYYLSELSVERRLVYLADLTAQIGESLKVTVDGAARDAVLIADLPSMAEFTRAQSEGDRARIKERLVATLDHWIRISPNMFQLRLLGVDGHEIIRFDRRDGKLERVPEAELQDKSQREFFRRALELGRGQYFVSAIDLNQEFGRIEVPHQPTLRVSTPVKHADGTAFGVVVINLAMERIFNEMNGATVGLGQLMVVNSAGDYLFHPDQGKTFGFDLGTRYLVSGDLPSTGYLFSENSSEPRNARDEVDGHVWLTRLHPVDLGGVAPGRKIWVAVQADQQTLTSYFVPLRNRLLLIAGFLVLLATVAGVMLARRIARPLERLSAAMNAFDPKSDVVPSPLPESDTREIADLSNAFSAMRDTVRETTKRLSLTNSELEQLTFAAAHDLQEPLRKITSFSELLREDLGPLVAERDSAAYLAALQRSAQRMRLLIDDILQLPQVGRLPKLHPTDSGEALKQALDALGPQLEETEAKVVAPALPEVLGDLHELSRVFQNLIGNAVKFRADGRAPVVEVLAAPSPEAWQFSVRDNGIGMESRYLHKIFLPFQRLHGKDRYPGTGMGLAICRRIVEGFGGRIWVDSTPGTGSVFHFTMPRVTPARPESGGPKP